MTDAPTSLHDRILAALAQLPDVLTRDADAPAGGGKTFKFLSEVSSLPLIRRALIENGLSILIGEASAPVRADFPPRRDRQTGQIVEDRQVVTVHLRAVVSNGLASEQFDLYGSSLDREGRGHASARTDALKGLRQALAIAAEDDPDSRPANGRTDGPATDKQRQEIADLAKSKGFTDAERDFVIDQAYEALTLDAVQYPQLKRVREFLSDPKALEFARDRLSAPAQQSVGAAA